MKRQLICALLAFFVVSIVAPRAFSAEKKDDARTAELRKKFKERLPKLHELKQQGIIGETYEGYVDFVKEKKSDAATLVDEENADRKELYKLIAAKTGATPETVAEQNAKRNFEKAAPGEFLKDANGKWRQKS